MATIPTEATEHDAELKAQLDELLERNGATDEFARLDEEAAKSKEKKKSKKSGTDDGEASQGEGEGGKQSQATRLVDLALQSYRMVRGGDGKKYATPTDGPAVAIPLRGDNGLRATLAKAYYQTNAAAAGSTALADALTVLEGVAGDQDPESINLRVAEHGECLVLDLGRVDGKCVVIRPNSWTLEAVSPVLFRRTRLVGPLPDPERPQPGAGDPLDKLRDLLNVQEDGFRLLVGWLIATFFPKIGHPLLALFGEQGTAKSTAGRLCALLVDPSDAPLRTPPKDTAAWTVQAAASWVVMLDNVSHISPEFSDTLCRAVTGAGSVNRALYTDDDVNLLVFRRAVGLTSIDAGGFKGDLAERALLIGLEVIPPEKRRTEKEVDDAFERDRPAILGALLDLAAKVLAARRHVQVDRLHRLADFTLILAALDNVTGWRSLEDFLEQADELTEAVIEADAVAEAVRSFASEKGLWEGTAGQLLEQISPAMPPRNWPRTSRAMSGHLTRIAPALRASGIEIERAGRSGHSGSRLLRLTAGDGATQPSDRQHNQHVQSDLLEEG